MTHEEYQRMLRIKRILKGMMKRGVIYDFAIDPHGLVMKFTREAPFVFYTHGGFLRSLRKGLIDVHIEVYKG